MKDGSEVQVSKLRAPVDEAAQKSINDAIGANVDHFSEISARDRLFAQSVYANPDEHLDTEVLPEGLAGMILAILMNAFGGRNFKLNPETGRWEETKNNGEPGNPVTNREFSEAYV